MSHFIGKTYWLNQENFNKVIAELEELQSEYKRLSLQKEFEIERLKKQNAKLELNNDFLRAGLKRILEVGTDFDETLGTYYDVHAAIAKQALDSELV